MDISALTLESLAKTIDHSLLHPTMTDQEVLDGCAIAAKYGTATVCCKPYSIEACVQALEGTGVGICSVIGFPHGNSQTSIKVAETLDAIQRGATEIDMVANAGKVLGGDWGFVEAEIRAINEACVADGAILKVIFENDFLQDTHIERLCDICSAAQVAFIKTSTGYGFVKQSDGSYNYKGATEHHIRLMRARSAPEVQIKAAGGVRKLSELVRVIELGCTRVGATATAAMLEEFKTGGPVAVAETKGY